MKKTVYQKFLQKEHKVRSIGNFRDIVYGSAELYPEKTAFALRDRKITYRELKKEYQYLCTTLLELGYKDKKIAITGANSYNWSLSYLCAATIGVAVPIDKELSAEDIYMFTRSAGCAAIIADDNAIKKINPETDGSYSYISMQNGNMSVRDLVGMGRQSYESGNREIDALPIDENVMKILIFTSGTMGHSKGVCLSQKNICFNMLSTAKMVKIRPIEHVLSILPLHHTYECTMGFLLIIYCGACISYCDDIQYIAKNIEEYHPSVVIAVPLLLEHMLKKSEKAVKEKLPEKYKAKVRNMSLLELLRAVPFYIRLVIKTNLRKAFGGRLHLFIVGAAGIDAKIIDTFCALGIRTLQGYGLTECAPLLAGNNDFYMKSDSTGLPIHGVEIKIEDPNSEGIGEIVAKGANIMLGYYEDKEATDEVMRGGFFHTGDLGYIDREGFLYITGRLKNVIITKNGKNIYPEELERRLNENELISESIVVGAKGNSGDVYVTAKILPDLVSLKNKLQGRIPSMEDIRSEVKAIIDKINDKLPAYKRIKSFVIINEEFEKTTTSKIKRYGKNVAQTN